MKKISMIAATIAMVAGVYSCGNGGSGKATLATDKDSASYAMGLMQGQQMGEAVRSSAEQGQKIDSLEFLRGFAEALKADSSKFSYYAGAITGANMARNMKEDGLNLDVFLKAFKAAFAQDSANIQLSDSVSETVLRAFGEKRQEEMMKKQAEEMEKKYGANKKKGADFINKFKTEAGVQTTPSGLAYKVEKEGNGASPVDGDKVTVKYKGTLVDGKVFDSNDQGVEFPVNGVIPGFTEILKLMKPGQKVKVVIPQELAYGDRENPSIEPFSTLIFEIELVKVTKGTAENSHPH